MPSKTYGAHFFHRFIFFIRVFKRFLLYVYVLCRWPYQFLSLSSPYAPLWYQSSTLHIWYVPCKVFDRNTCCDRFLMFVQVLGSDSDAYTVLCRLRFGHKDEAFLATASKLMIVLGLVFIVLSVHEMMITHEEITVRESLSKSNTKSEKSQTQKMD